MRPAALFPAALIGLAACSSPADLPPLSLDAVPLHTYGVSVLPPSSEPAVLRARLDALGSAMPAVHDVQKQAAGGTLSPAELDAALRALAAAAPTPEARSILRQHTSRIVLTAVLRDSRTADAHVQAVGYHTRVLLDEGTPEPQLVHRALLALDRSWSETERRSAALRAAAAAEAFADRNPSGASPASGLPTIEPRLYAAARELRRYAA